VIQHARVLEAQEELDLAELDGLEAGGRVQVVAEAQEVLGPHRLQDPDLLDEQPLDLHHTAQEARPFVDVVLLDLPGRAVHLVEDELEPELVDLVNDDEERLVVVGGRGQALLQLEELRDPKVRAVGERLVRHGEMVAPSDPPWRRGVIG
jgi:hypothetical protein